MKEFKRRDRLMALISTRSELVSTSLNLYSVVVSRARAVTHAASATIELIHGNDLVCRAVSGNAPLEVGAVSQLDGDYDRRPAAEGKQVIWNAAPFSAGRRGASGRKLSVGAMVAVPMIADGHPFGLLTAWAEEPGHFDQQDLARLHHLGELLGAALDPGTEIDTFTDLHSIGQFTQRLDQATSNYAVRDAVCEAAINVCGGSWAAYWEPSADGTLVASSAIGVEQGLLITAPSRETSAVAEAFVSGTPRFAPDLARDHGVSERLTELTGSASALFVPVIDGETHLGVLVVGWRSRVQNINEAAATAVGYFAGEAAVAIVRVDMVTRLDTMARTDALTGVPNRRHWDEELSREVARSARDQRPVCVATLDLDYFKRYNDRFGHQAGDKLLQDATTIWHLTIREVDFLARCGGEEFGVLLPACSLPEGIEIVARLCKVMPAGQTVSAGVACWDGSESVLDLTRRADEALYRAKRKGRNRVEAARPLPRQSRRPGPEARTEGKGKRR
ncbi:MAG: diguanylate cyclase [Candidatus Dormibacteria bacterium]